MNRTRNTFTLVEMLMVIVIIGVLMGMLLPAVAIAKQKAKIVQAKTEARSIITAIKMYESTYGYLPVAAGQANDVLVSNAPDAHGDYEHLIGFLSLTRIGPPNGSPAHTSPAPDEEGNSRRVKMLEVKIPGLYKDPWEQDYEVIIDANYDGKIEADPASGPEINGMLGTISATRINVPVSVVVWSKGPDKADSTTAGEKANQDNVYSFETNWRSGDGHMLR